MAEYKDIWCVAEWRQGKLYPSVHELLGAGRKLADETGSKLCALIIGSGAEESAAALGAYGADRVYLAEHPAFANFADEVHARALSELVKKHNPRLILLPGNIFGRSLAARAAALIPAGLAAEVSEIVYDKTADAMRIVRSCAGGSQFVSIAWDGHRPEMATVRTGSFPKAVKQEGRACEIVKETLDPSGWPVKTRYRSFKEEESQEIDLAQADIIISGGAGIGGADNFRVLKELAHLLNGAVGASRRAVDSGWIAYRHQVGLTGRTVKPKLYVACAISGQIQHLAGMSQADVIVAINKDPQAPLMGLASFAVEGDIFEVVPAVIEEIKRVRG